jgi:hypothetical protein
VQTEATLQSILLNVAGSVMVLMVLACLSSLLDVLGCLTFRQFLTTNLFPSFRAETSLRYAMCLISAASLACQRRKGKEVEIEDISRVYTLFVDVKRSTQFLMEYQEQFMFSDVVGQVDEEVAMEETEQ